jgi:hypothetical protein
VERETRVPQSPGGVGVLRTAASHRFGQEIDQQQLSPLPEAPFVQQRAFRHLQERYQHDHNLVAREVVDVLVAAAQLARGLGSLRWQGRIPEKHWVRAMQLVDEIVSRTRGRRPDDWTDITRTRGTDAPGFAPERKTT